jgi:diacylglycerol kinase (ATP)
MPSTKVILNPVAGRGYGARVEPRLRQLLKAEGIDHDLVRTEGRWHAPKLAAQAISDGYELVVAAGGDGTMHEVVNGLMAAAGDGVAGTLGVLPIGSGSDFAHTVGVPPDLQAACHRLANGTERVVDLGWLAVDGGTPRWFDNTVGIGFDGVVTLEALKFKRLRGMALYLPVVLKTVFVAFKAPQVSIRYDDQELDMTALMVVVCNGPREGGGFFVAPEARPDDGLFDLCVADEVGKLGMLRLIPHFMQGTHIHQPTVTMARARRVTITSPDPLVAHADGEMLCTAGHTIECELLPKRLRVQC